MSRYLLDTNICIHLLKNEYNVKEKIAAIGTEYCYLSEITLAELLFGIEKGTPEKAGKNWERYKNIETLFSGRILSIRGCLHEYARQKASLRRAGRPVADFDILIGATAIVNEMKLVTRNTRDFKNLSHIQLDDWIN